MLLPEAPLETLIEQLKLLPVSDRGAILARLTPRERKSIEIRLRRSAAAPARPASPFSVDIAERVARRNDKDAPMTEAARAALERALPSVLEAPEHAPPAASLVDTLAGLFRRRSA